jgi:hypothetical protein
MRMLRRKLSKLMTLSVNLEREFLHSLFANLTLRSSLRNQPILLMLRDGRNGWTRLSMILTSRDGSPCTT